MTKREELVALANEFDDIAVDADGKCYWCDVANAQTHLRAQLHRFAAQASAAPPEREADRTTLNSIPEDGFNCIFLYENGREVGCLNGPQNDPDVIARAKHWCRLSSRGDGEGKSSDGVPGKQPASGAAAAPIETEDAEVAFSPSELLFYGLTDAVGLSVAIHSIGGGKIKLEFDRINIKQLIDALRLSEAISADVLAMKEAWRKFSMLMIVDGDPPSIVYPTDIDANAWASAYDDLRAAIDKLSPEVKAADTFQSRVQPWMMACFGPEISADRIERNHRFLEEALELVQSTGCTQSEAHQLVDYVYGRPQGEINQEVGGVMVTLAALCLANGIDMHEGGETELARIWTMVEKIRAKQAAKPKHSPLPEVKAEPRPCTCHPSDNPPVPCAEKYAYSECVKAEGGRGDGAPND